MSSTNNPYRDENGNVWREDERGSWQSGIKFIEEKRSRKLFKGFFFIIAVMMAASIGGVVGGYYVKSYYDTSYYDNLNKYSFNDDDSLNTSAENNKSSTKVAQSTVSKVAEKIGPAVVGVDNHLSTWGNGSVLQGSGSGIIFDKRGYIVTNDHVIEGSTSVTITLSGGKKIPARVVGRDTSTDIAVLKINAINLPVAKLGDSSNIKAGDTAIAIGNPLGEEYAGTVTVGVISAVNRKLNVDGREYGIIQTDAAINSGNSGGALCNANGEIIGINRLKLNDADGMGFAIAINEAKPVINALMAKGYASRPFIGISGSFVDDEKAKIYGIPVGIYVQDVYTGSSAEEIGLRYGDVVVSFDSTSLSKIEDLNTILAKHKVSDIVPMRVWRQGTYFNVKIRIGNSFGQNG